MTVNGKATDQGMWLWGRIMKLLNETPIDKHRRLGQLLYQIPAVKRFSASAAAGDTYWLTNAAADINRFGFSKKGE